MSLKRYTVLLVSAITIAGCLVPEKFVASIDVKPDLAYTFQYSGTVLNILASAQLKKTGKLTSREDSDLRAEEANLKKDPEVTEAKYLDGGRYKIAMQATRKAGQPMQALNTFSVIPGKDGVLEITSAKLTEKDKKGLNEAGLAIDGKFEVSVPRNAEVIEHNADSTPFLGFGSYAWKIGRTDQRPVIKIRLKK